jgi:long-chain acyl-CoA synthetase
LPDAPHGDLPALCAAALARDPAWPALHFAGHWIPWGTLARIASTLEQVLLGSELPPNAPVCFVPRNRPCSVAALLGLIASGRSIRMIYAFQSAEAIADALAVHGCGAVVLERDDWAPVLAEATSALGCAAALLDDDGAALAPGEAQAEPHHRMGSESDPAISILTSGTTGPPKSFRLPFSTIARYFAPAPGAGPGPTAPPPLLYLPMGNISGIYSFIPALLGGDGAVLIERFSIDAWLDYVQRWRPIRSGIPPACMAELLERNVPYDHLASLQAMGSGAAPLDPALHRAFEERYGIPILTSYGATEFAGPVAAMTLPLHAQWGEAKRGSVGCALPGACLRIVDATTGDAMPAGVAGVLEVISPRIGPVWLRTSDIGHLDGDGFLWLHGRADGAINRGGFKLLPETIERVLGAHPAVAEVAVVGLADARLGAVPAAAVRLKAGALAPEPTELAAYVRTRLPATHIPALWRIGVDLPRTASQKIDRAAVAALFQ